MAKTISIRYTLLIGDFREPLPGIEAGEFAYIGATLNQMKEAARLVFAARPEATGLECDIDGIAFVITPQLSQAVEQGYHDSPGY